MNSRVTGGRAGAAISAIGRASLLWRPDTNFVRRHRRTLLGLAGLVVAALAAAFIPWTVPKQTVEREIAAQVKSATGLDLVSSGQATFSALPPRISVADVALTDAPHALSIQTRKVRARVRLLPLLAGRLEIAEATLVRPHLTMDLARPPAIAGAIAQAASAPAATLEADRTDEVRLGVLRVQSGSAFLQRHGEPDIVIDHIDGTFDWRRISAPATITGTFAWRGEPASVDFWLGQPANLLRGDQSATTLRVKSVSLSLSANGNVSTGLHPQFVGRVVASAPSLRHVGRLANIAIPLPGLLGDTSLTSDATIADNGFSLSNLRLSLDRNEFEGALALRNDGPRPSLAGTLAASQLNLDPIVAEITPVITPDGRWTEAPFELRDLSRIDMDLRVSAARTRLRRVQFDDAALSLLMKAGRLELALAEAKAYKGLFKARLSAVGAGGNALDLRGNAQLANIDAGALAWDLLDRPRISGTLNASVSMEAAGDSVLQTIHGLDGKAQFSISQGDIGGLDLNEALRRVATRPLSSLNEIRGGRTVFDRAVGTFRINKGVAEIVEGSAQAPGLSIGMTGSMQIAERTFALKGVATQASGDSKPATEPTQLPFDVIGSWDDPAIVPDTQSLIRRSGAAERLYRETGTQAAGEKPVE
ncbi:MAG: AsmA protein [Methylobacteriaceae bacterium]|jgi:AsmA protein|nr:AsmA protein [Methylobacteriaceae bacterium]